MNSTYKPLIAMGSFSMAIAVILGALGAHDLEELISPERLDSFKTGVRYQAWHSIALIILGFAGRHILTSKGLKTCASFFLAGIFLFSFSIYLLSTRDVLGIDSWKSVLGPITPVGGLLLITGWIYLGLKSSASAKNKSG